MPTALPLLTRLPCAHITQNHLVCRCRCSPGHSWGELFPWQQWSFAKQLQAECFTPAPRTAKFMIQSTFRHTQNTFKQLCKSHKNLINAKVCVALCFILYISCRCPDKLRVCKSLLVRKDKWQRQHRINYKKILVWTLGSYQDRWVSTIHQKISIIKECGLEKLPGNKGCRCSLTLKSMELHLKEIQSPTLNLLSLTYKH